MEKLSIALISGGTSSERQVSIDSGEQVYNALDKDKYQPVRYDPKTDLARLVNDAPKIDAALVILHGPMGEDGTIQGMLDLLEIPYQGSGVIGSAMAMDKLASKHLYEHADIPVTPYVALTDSDPVNEKTIVRQLGLPLVVKPSAAGSSIGMSIVKTTEALAPAIALAFKEDKTVLIESFITGIELTCSVVGNDDLVSYPLIEIIPEQGHEFFDYESKYVPGAAREICPARIDDALAKQAKDYAIMAHKALFCRGYTRTDLILSGRDLYVIETNTIPGMTKTSLMPQSAAAVGISFTELLDILISLSLEDHLHKRHLNDHKRLERIKRISAEHSTKHSALSTSNPAKPD